MSSTAPADLSAAGRASRNKGARAERDVAEYLRAHGWPYAERRQTGVSGADIAGTPGLMWEIKACERIELGAWVGQVEKAAAAATIKPRYSAVIIRRRGRPEVGEWYAVLPVASYVQLLAEAGWGPE